MTLAGHTAVLTLRYAHVLFRGKSSLSEYSLISASVFLSSLDQKSERGPKPGWTSARLTNTLKKAADFDDDDKDETTFGAPQFLLMVRAIPFQSPISRSLRQTDHTHQLPINFLFTIADWCCSGSQTHDNRQ